MQRRHTSRLLWGIALLAVGLSAAACAGGGGSDPARALDATEADAPTEAAAGARHEVAVDGSSEDATASFHRFFPDRLAVHPGDTVVFQRPDNGEPHTVTFSTDPPGRGDVPGGKFFDGGFSNPPRTDTSMPCFLREGRPPAQGCTAAQQEPVPFDGTHSWFNSGGLLDQDEFVVELAEDLAPGSYLFTCLIHTGTMRVAIDVVAPDAPADDPEAVLARGRDQLERERARVRRMLDNPLTVVEGKVGAATTAPPFVAWLNTFAPEDAEVAVGGTVTWTIRGMHTISFNAPESARPFFRRAADGSVEENPEAAEPRGDPAGWDGQGVLNSGLQEGLFPPAFFSVTFTNPGTYAYRCLVHFDMEGKVTVRG